MRDSPVAQNTGNFASLLRDVASQVDERLAREFDRSGFPSKFAPMYANMLVGMVALTGQWWLDVRKPKKDEVVAHVVNLAWNGIVGPREEAAPGHRARRRVLTTPPLRTDRLDLEPVSRRARRRDGRASSPTAASTPSTTTSPRHRSRSCATATPARPPACSPDGREVWHSWIVRERESGAAIGFVQATVGATAGSSLASVDTADTPYDGRTSAELAWVIGVPWQGRGYATEAATAVRDAVRGPGSVTGDDVALVHAHIAPGHVALRDGRAAPRPAPERRRPRGRDPLGARPRRLTFCDEGRPCCARCNMGVPHAKTLGAVDQVSRRRESFARLGA